MIVESAFLKIPEILLSNKSQDFLYEANISNLITSGIILELNARNINNPLMNIDMERRYNKKENIRCDIYLDFSNFMNKLVFSGYGINSKNWIEVKYFGGMNRNKGNETKSANAGAIMFDIFRIIYYTHINDNIVDSRYCLSVFNSKPLNYLALKRRDGSYREWINGLLTAGIHDIKFNLALEPETIKKEFSGFSSVKMDLKVRNTVFEPIFYEEVKGQDFHGYLNQILCYTIEVNDKIYTNL